MAAISFRASAYLPSAAATSTSAAHVSLAVAGQNRFAFSITRPVR